MMRASFLALAVVAATTASCSSDGFGRVRNPPRLLVTLDEGSKTGSPTAPLGLQVGTPVTFKIKVSALTQDGGVDTSFNRYVRISAKPGAVASFTGPDVDGRNVLLRDGQSITIDVALTNAYGPTYLVADDLGYVPADPLRDPPPACSNGKDDDGDGTVDFPADTGCAFANDDSEEPGTYGEGASPTIWFALPRIADVRGVTAGNGRTPYPREQILIDTGWNDDNTYRFDTVVTRLSSNGFYVTDRGDTRGFNSVFAFNFNAPPRMRVCDRMKNYGGTANEFFGFTQISYPTWTLEEWDPSVRLCSVPAPERLVPTTISDVTELLKRTANLVRVETTPDGAQKTRVTPKFGPGDVPKGAGGAYIPGPDNSNCDFDKNGKINSFAAGDPEGTCSTACTADPECTEYSNYISRGTFRLTVTDSNGKSAAIQADASASSSFDPLALKGQAVRSFAGTMSFFSGGAQYTVEVRCKDDIVLDLKSGPFLEDFTCTDNKECTTDRGLPPDFTCVTLSGGAKGCRKVTPAPNPADPNLVEPPPLACVFPRTFLENNPQ
ncbi:hypothetical protein BH11MYX4_BH11MYX4_16790 [soil metagenome]